MIIFNSERLKRQLPIFGKRGQEIISKVKIALVGVSGNGSPFLLFSVLAGFLDWILVDPDVLEIHNLNRFVLGGIKDIGRPKVEIAREKIIQIDPNIRCVTIQADVRSDSAIRALRCADWVVAAVDVQEPRILIQQFCIKNKKPSIDLGSGTIIENGEVKAWGSRAHFYEPGKACLGCAGFNSEPDEEEVQTSFVTPNVIIAAAALELLVSNLTGIGETPNFLLYDSLKHEMISMNIMKRDDCRLCGTRSDDHLRLHETADDCKSHTLVG